MKFKVLLVSLLFAVGAPAMAQDLNDVEEINLMDELNPFDPEIERILDLYDAEYEAATGQSAHLVDDILDFGWFNKSSCYRISCTVYARVVKSEQRMYLYYNGQLIGNWLVSTGTKGHGTPNFDTHPNGRIYDRYTSTRYPGGDYDNLGNMPYAVFIRGGFAIHGTGRGNWSKLGRVASHGCIRLHPDNAKTFNRLVRKHGIRNTWITVE